MKGTNTFCLNTETMIEALQYWLNSQFNPGLAPKVTDVSYTKEGYLMEFRVSVKEPSLAESELSEQDQILPKGS